METREGASGERRGMTMTAMGNLGMSVLLCGYHDHPTPRTAPMARKAALTKVITQIKMCDTDGLPLTLPDD